MFNQCRHIMPSGARCKSPALKDQSFCYYHCGLNRAASTRGQVKESLLLPSLEDPQGIQMALTQILGALDSPYLDSKRAGLYLYGLQIATQLAARAPAPEPRDVVRSLSSDTADGEVLAPESVQCEPGAECDACVTRDECVLPHRVAYVAARHVYAQALKNLQQQQRAAQEVQQRSLAEQWANEPQWEDPDFSAPGT